MYYTDRQLASGLDGCNKSGSGEATTGQIHGHEDIVKEICLSFTDIEGGYGRNHIFSMYSIV